MTFLIHFSSKCPVIFVHDDARKLPPTPFTWKPLPLHPRICRFCWDFFLRLWFFTVLPPLPSGFNKKKSRFSAILVPILAYLSAFFRPFSKGSRFVMNLKDKCPKPLPPVPRIWCFSWDFFLRFWFFTVFHTLPLQFRGIFRHFYPRFPRVQDL